MHTLHPRSTRPASLFPYTPLFGSFLGHRPVTTIAVATIAVTLVIAIPAVAPIRAIPTVSAILTLATRLATVIIALGAFGLFGARSEEPTSELQSLMRISYAVFCLQKNNTYSTNPIQSSAASQ